MALPQLSLTFLGFAIVLGYLVTFVVFAFIRIITGVSIQRLGWASFRRISFSPKEGVKVEIRGLGWALHRPTFAQPTWVSIVLEELKITVDLKALGTKTRHAGRWPRWTNGSIHGRREQKSFLDTPPASPQGSPGPEVHSQTRRSRTWERLTGLKEKVKRLHRKIHWIRLVDFVAKDTTFAVADVGAVQIARFTVAVDTRAKKVDRSRLFQHRSAKSVSQRPAEWIILIRSILFIPDCKEASEKVDKSTEILDNCLMNVHGLLVPELDGLRDASVGLKLGRVNLPYDDVRRSLEQIKALRQISKEHDAAASDTEASFGDYIEEFDNPGTKEEAIVQTVSDSKEFLSSMLRGIQEVQFAISFFGMTQRIREIKPDGNPVFLNMSMKEVGLDLLRLDQKSPAHLMYFASGDVAHQALVTAISISVGIDDGHEHPERLLYIPMATATVRTTLPSKTIQLARDRNVAERNANILYANFVVTSPSVDLDPRHLPLVLAILQSRRSRASKQKRGPRQQHHLISRLLPKANIKTTVHEPVVRVSLPPMEKEKRGTDEFDLLISAMSSMSLDIESSHASGGDLHYALASSLRINTHNLYYQTASGEKLSLLDTESSELKVQVSASPEVAVIASANLQTFSVYMTRPEISEGVRQIVKQLRHGSVLRPHTASGRSKQNFLRKLPPWLQHVQLNGQDFNVEIAGIDAKVSKEARGMALHLESWSAEYKADKSEQMEPRPTRRAASRSVSRRGDESPRTASPASPTSPGRRRQADVTDGRRLAVHTQGLQVSVVESTDTWEPEPFLSMPRFEVAFTTSSDKQGPIFHINSFAKSLSLNYSLYRHFAVGMAVLVLRRTFAPKPSRQEPPAPQRMHSNHFLDPTTPIDARIDKPEIVTVDFRSSFLQLKTQMPADPPMMLQIFGLEAGQHRWARPFARTKLIRVYVETPSVKKVWSRIMSFRNVRFDYRLSRRHTGKGFVEERSFDVAMDATRIAIPHQLVFHKISENIINVKKTVEQVHHRFVTGTDEYILEKLPEGPKHVPRISIKSNALLFEIEDGSFDWKLGCIFRAGLEEQKQRLARDEAFRLKVKKLMEIGRGKTDSNIRTQSAAPARARSPRARIRRKHREQGPVRSRSADASDRERSRSPPSPKHSRLHRHHHDEHRGRRMHYDGNAKCTMTDYSQTTVDHAWDQLLRLNAKSWRRRIDHVLNFQNKGMQDIRSSFGVLDDIPDDVEQPESIMAIPNRPALMAVEISELSILLDKPSFPINDYPRFLHRIGKGMPLDMKYGLLIPVNVNLGMGELRVALRDYPLPILHVPALAYGQSHKHPAFQLKTDFVIAEEFRDGESIRHINVPVVPPDMDESSDEGLGYAVDVQRTISSIKTYSDMSIDINTSNPTKITWGTSYQPAIQDTMQVIESFTKPPMDPSERVGFWDKIRLAFHSRVKVSWAGDGDVHVILKGTRDPYDIIGDGAGFVMCWRKNVVWSICQDPSPKNFMTVDSEEYVLAIPDANFYVRNSMKSDASDSRSISSGSSGARDKMFHKTVMKLHGNVRWSSGLVFERDTDHGGRSMKFIPHWDVILKNAKFAKSMDNRPYDAFRGFRSHHIHMSVGIASPVNREWSVSNLKPAEHYNSVHMTPRFFSHFFSWWSMFSGVMSLPVHQGPLWPGPEKSSKKFGRHLATIKYSLLISPLYMSHVYKHKDAEELAGGDTHATGLKLKLDSFMLDLHQRREVFRKPVKGSHNKISKTSAIKINQVQLDFIAADIRAVSAKIEGLPSDKLDEAADQTMSAYHRNENPKLDLSKFTIPDEDPNWIDMDDFIELDDMMPTDSSPAVKILPLAFAPRFTYFRETDHGDAIAGDPGRTSPFGHEDTHECVMTTRNDPRLVQSRLIQERLKQIDKQIEHNIRAAGKYELEVIRESTNKQQARDKYEAIRKYGEVLQSKRGFLENMLRTIQIRLSSGDRRAVPDQTEEERFYEAKEEYDISGDEEHVDAAPFTDYVSDFNNRFVIHNMQFKWTNSLRNIILRYIHQVSQRRGFVYYMSRSSIKFILDIIEEQKKGKFQKADGAEDADRRPSVVSPGVDDDVEVQDRIEQLLHDAKKFVQADDPAINGHKPGDASSQNISHDFAAQNSYHLRLVAPQIQLQSEKNTKNAVLLTAKGMSLKVIQIMDKDRIFDEVSGLVQRRFFGSMDNLQVFATTFDALSKLDMHMYSGNRYGAPKGSSWPPWVPLEVMFDFSIDPFGFNRVVQRTSASLRYDKYNTLRLKYNDDVSQDRSAQSRTADGLEERIDHLWVEFPHLRAICDSNQYYALYVIVLDLLLYSEPLEKTRNERLERIMLASDFSDLTNVPDLVTRLQDRIRQMEELKMHFQIQEKRLDRQGWKERLILEHDLAACEDELFFTMKAITSSQRKHDDRGAQEQSTGLLRWYISASELVWHLIRGENESLVELQLKGALYDRTDNADGSNHNVMEIERIRGLNLLPDAIYPEIIAPFVEDKVSFHNDHDIRMLRVQWLMLEAIAGIPVMDHFEINLFPLRLQLEREAGSKLFEYVFPSAGQSGSNENGFSPFMIKHSLPSAEGEENNDTNDALINTPSLTSDSSSPQVGRPDEEELEVRLQPTLTLQEDPRPKSQGFMGRFNQNRSHTDLATLRNGAGTGDMRKNVLRRDHSSEALAPRPQSHRSTSNYSSTPKRSTEAERARRFSVSRQNSEEKSKKERSDDLSQMLYRASNFMTLAYVKIPSVVLCLSYKGKGQRNIEDVHNLVFRMPTLEYRNKTWSNYDLFVQLKKEVVKALLNHVGTIIGNKFSHHRPTKQQQSRLREIANSSTLLGSSTPSQAASEYPSTGTSETNSMQDYSPGGLDTPPDPSRKSFASGADSELSREVSNVSSASETNGLGLIMGTRKDKNGSVAPSRMPSEAPTEVPHVVVDGASDRTASRTQSIRRHFTLGNKERDQDDEGDEAESSSTRRKTRLIPKKLIDTLISKHDS